MKVGTKGLNLVFKKLNPNGVSPSWGFKLLCVLRQHCPFSPNSVQYALIKCQIKTNVIFLSKYAILPQNYLHFYNLRIFGVNICRSHLCTFPQTFLAWKEDSVNLFTFRMYGLWIVLSLPWINLKVSFWCSSSILFLSHWVRYVLISFYRIS